MAKTGFQSIDEYIDTFPEEVQNILQKISETIQQTAPDAKEVISYQMPTFRLHGILVYFAAFKHYVSFFPTPSVIKAFKEELSPCETSKGTVKFSIGKPVPFELIERIVEFRVKENLQKTTR